MASLAAMVVYSLLNPQGEFEHVNSLIQEIPGDC